MGTELLVPEVFDLGQNLCLELVGHACLVIPEGPAGSTWASGAFMQSVARFAPDSDSGGSPV